GECFQYDCTSFLIGVVIHPLSSKKDFPNVSYQPTASLVMVISPLYLFDLHAFLSGGYLFSVQIGDLHRLLNPTTDESKCQTSLYTR
ncbi:hypothetical protein L9F63_007659, partial [Diploptera punctata]